MHCKLTEEQVAELKPISDVRGDPLRRRGDEFWFFDETWSDLYGPYASFHEADAALSEYAKTL